MPDEVEKPASVQKQDDRIRTLDKWFCDAMDTEQTFLKQAIEDEKFYIGDQWDPQDLQDLKRYNRPALTYNHIFSIVNVVNGYHRQNQQDLKAHNIRGGTQTVAEILTALLKHIKQAKNGDWEVSFAHLYGLITGKAFIEIGIDKDEDMINGEPYYEYESCFDIVVDPYGKKYDLTDRDFYFKSVWMPKAKLERNFPDILKDGIEVADYDRQIAMGVETHNYKEGAKYQGQTDDDLERYRYRVKVATWKEYKTKRFLVNVQTGRVDDVTHLNQGTIDRIMQLMPDFKHVKRTLPELHLAQYIGNKELFHTVNPYGKMRNFPLAGFFPYFFRTSVQGVVTQLKDPQREHNKRLSQALHHLNSSANSGFTADADAVDDWDDFTVDVAGVGRVKKIKKGARFEKDQPTELSQGHIALAEMGKMALKGISGVNADLLGERAPDVNSGIAIARRQAQGLVSTEIIHDNLRLTLKVLGDRAIEMIQNSGCFSREEILRLVADETDTEYEINKKQEGTNRVLNDMTLGRYEAIVSTQVQTPTARMARYFEIVDAIKAGVPIPPEILVNMSDWPEKDKILKKMEEMQAAQIQAVKLAQQEKEKDQAFEIEKIHEQAKADMLQDAQKGQIDMVRDQMKPQPKTKPVEKPKKKASK